MNLSYWEYQSFFKDIDILIIGSGIVGLNAALTLKEKFPQRKIIVVERGILPAGASTKNAGFACFGSVSELLDDLTQQSEDAVWTVLEKRWLGLQRLQDRIGGDNMDYYQYGNYEIFGDNEQALFEKCVSKMAIFNRAIASITNVPDTFTLANHHIKHLGLGKTKNLIWNKSEGQINTGKMMVELLRLVRQQDIPIYNGLTIEHLTETATAVQLGTSEGWTFEAKQILVATNGFTQKILPQLAIQPARNQVLITQPLDNLKLKGCFHYLQGYVYFRNIDNRILLGGGRHLDKAGETTDKFGFRASIQEYLIDILKTVIIPNQNVAIDHWWSGILGVGDAKKPIIQKLSDRIVVAARMGGMGVAIGSLVGEEGAALLD